MKICPNCQKENPEDAKYCNNCSYPLEIPKVREIENPEKLIKIGYLLSIILGWLAPVLTILTRNFGMFIGFFAILLPLGFLKSNNPKIRKHAIIQTLIYLTGLIVQILLLIYKF